MQRDLAQTVPEPFSDISRIQKASPCRRPGIFVICFESILVSFKGLRIIMKVPLDWAGFSCRLVEKTDVEICAIIVFACK